MRLSRVTSPPTSASRRPRTCERAHPRLAEITAPGHNAFPPPPRALPKLCLTQTPTPRSYEVPFVGGSLITLQDEPSRPVGCYRTKTSKRLFWNKNTNLDKRKKRERLCRVKD